MVDHNANLFINVLLCGAVYLFHIDGHEDLPANGKFVTVMRSSSEVVIKELTEFVYKAFQQRLHHV